LISLAALAIVQWDYLPAMADASALKQERPSIKADRSREDWSLLADPKLRTEPLDSLKYIPLFSSNPDSYISLGLNLREIRARESRGLLLVAARTVPYRCSPE
jgi:hypothetical protein